MSYCRQYGLNILHLLRHCVVWIRDTWLQVEWSFWSKQFCCWTLLYSWFTSSSLFHLPPLPSSFSSSSSSSKSQAQTHCWTKARYTLVVLAEYDTFSFSSTTFDLITFNWLNCHVADNILHEEKFMKFKSLWFILEIKPALPIHLGSSPLPLWKSPSHVWDKYFTKTDWRTYSS